MQQFTLFLTLLVVLFTFPACAQETLTINANGQQTAYTRNDLLRNPNLVTLKQVHLPTYPNQSFDLRALPLCTLLNIPAKNRGDILKIRASDKYITYFNLDRVYPCDKTRAAIAYIAIEDPNKPWPIVAKLKRSAGPFYLIWQGKDVAQTDWVFAVENVDTTEKNPFSALLPANSTSQEIQGLAQFANKCGPCHSINLVGNLEIGPDLNIPQNPTEYFSDKQLRQFIRNPQSMRYMKNDKMLAFSKQLLSEDELNAIIAFLQLMRTHKIKELPQNAIPGGG